MGDRERRGFMPSVEHEVLTRVQDHLVELAALVEISIANASTALIAADVHLAEQVISDDATIDAANNTVEELCLQILSEPRLNSEEVRAAVACLKMSTTLERMGDLAAHIAKQARLRFPGSSVPADLQSTFRRMGELATTMMADCREVLASADLSLAACMTESDLEMDQIHRSLFASVLAPTWDNEIQAAVDVTLLSRFYERFADHALSVVRRVAFVVTGEPYGITDLSSAAESL